MITELKKLAKRTFSKPDDVKEFNNGRLERVDLDEVSFARILLRPGWRWSVDVRPLGTTETCQSPHLQYVIRGHLRVHMDDGTELDLQAGDVAEIPPGHEAYVVGYETFEAIDFTGMKDYFK